MLRCVKDVKVDSDKWKVEGLEHKICIDSMQLEHVSEFTYLGYVLDESGTDEAVHHRRGVAGAIRSLVNARGLQLKHARDSHKTSVMPVLMYSSEK